MQERTGELKNAQNTSASQQEEKASAQHIYELMKCMHQLSTTELRKQLSEYQINWRGKRSIVYERLKKYVQKNEPELFKNPHQVGKTAEFFDFLIVIDFECTCDATRVIDYPHSIIEFPAVLIDVKEKRIMDTFRSYVRPKDDARLSDFCEELTGITQADVNAAPSFLVVLDMFRKWMEKHGIVEGRRYAFVSDGPWDFAKFLQMQCIECDIPIPNDFRKYVNIRRCYLNKYCKKKNPMKITLQSMLDELNMTFDGRQHCGLDDARNIAKIVLRLLQDNFEIRVNEMLVKKSEAEQKHDLQQITNNDGREAFWRKTLPYKVVSINRDSFISGEYLEYIASN